MFLAKLTAAVLSNFLVFHFGRSLGVSNDFESAIGVVLRHISLPKSQVLSFFARFLTNNYFFSMFKYLEKLRKLNSFVNDFKILSAKITEATDHEDSSHLSSPSNFLKIKQRTYLDNIISLVMVLQID